MRRPVAFGRAPASPSRFGRLFGRVCGTLSCLAVGLALAGCDSERGGDSAIDATPAEPRRLEDQADDRGDRSSDPAPDAASNAPTRELYFGDLHVHTGFSLDAYNNGVHTGPADAYRFARGEAIAHAAGGTIRLAGPPLDFLAVTDHAEYLGVATAALRDEHPLHRQPLIQRWLGSDPRLAALARQRIGSSLYSRQPFPAFVADEIVRPAWREVVELANAHDQPGVFSALIGFEYTSNPEEQNLHRNLIFRGAKVPPRPYSAFESENPEDLWRWMDEARASGDDVIAIPHNANGSNGLMFSPSRFDGGALDARQAALRARNEPVAEVIQIKGQSETTPRLSPEDEWAEFEVVPWRTTTPELSSRESGSYLREALGVGLALHEQLGVDPFALGMVGSTDTHNSASPVVESDYFGKLGRADGTPVARIGDPKARTGPAVPLNVTTYWSAAGLAGIWARENTRAELFDALRRRETFATSGPRIAVRLFAGFDFSPADVEGDFGRVGYAKGVPMGGELTAKAGAGSPVFLVRAQQDPLEAPLERAQIVKVWRRDGETHERVFDVACAGGGVPDPVRHRCPVLTSPSTIDPDTCEVPADGGARELAAGWRDPDFDPGERALYYARVLQRPTCRWSSFDAMRSGQARPAGVPATIQERALTSPIWITPGEPTPSHRRQP